MFAELLAHPSLPMTNGCSLADGPTGKRSEAARRLCGDAARPGRKYTFFAAAADFGLEQECK